MTTAIAIAAAINKPKIDVKETDNNDGISVNFMVYFGAMFGGLLLVGGGHRNFHGLHDQYEEVEGGERGGIINIEKEGNSRQGQI